jgi:CBS domain-containing protein
MDQSLSGIMTTGLLTVLPGERLEVAANIMRQENVRHLLVADESQYVLGIISERDLERALESDTLKRTHLTLFPPNARVENFMSSHFEWIDKDRLVTEAIQKMLDLKISAIVVREGNKIEGILTTDDLLRLLSECLRPHGAKAAIAQWAFASPLGAVTQFLSAVGL